MIRNFLYILALQFLAFNSHNVNCVPEYNSCTAAQDDEVVRFRDLTDCAKFYYCVEGLAEPFQEECPNDRELGIALYFNPNTTNCDLCQNIDPRLNCCGSGGDKSETTTTSTTQRPPRPPKLDDSNVDIGVDCTHSCGMFPNANGECNSYIVCVNGQKTVKTCNDGQLFDGASRECKPAENATCWTEPVAAPDPGGWTRRQVDCRFHNNQATRPVENTSDGGRILANPVVTNWGDWNQWTYCPAGTYATGIMAWRTMLEEWQSSTGRADQMGLTHVSFRCQTPGGNETDMRIEGKTENLSDYHWDEYFMCKGAVVGFRLNSVNSRGWNGGDQLATDNVQGMCSCSGPVFKPYDEARYEPQRWHRGDWTQTQYCEKYQAICGMQTQHHAYREWDPNYDNTGLNNMKVKCCGISNPLDKCSPVEERRFIRTCDNSKSDVGLRCDFESVTGLSMDYDGNRKLVDFYSSVGHTFEENQEKLSTEVPVRLEEKREKGEKMEYDWNEVDPVSITEEEVVTPQTMFIKPFEKHEVYQILGKCSYFLIRTNRFVRVITDKDGKKREESFEV